VYWICTLFPVAARLSRRSTASRLLWSWVRIPPGTWVFVVYIVCFQVEVSATSWSLVQRSHTDCGASLCVIKKPRGRGGHNPRWAAEPEKTITEFVHWIIPVLNVMWNYRELLPVMAIMFRMADSPAFALSFAAPCVSFILIRLLSKKAMQSACSLIASTSAWSQRMFADPQSLPCYHCFFSAVLPQKNEGWVIGDHRLLYERLIFSAFKSMQQFSRNLLRT
jgi:hypothetical protein